MEPELRTIIALAIYKAMTELDPRAMVIGKPTEGRPTSIDGSFELLLVADRVIADMEQECSDR